MLADIWYAAWEQAPVDRYLQEQLAKTAYATLCDWKINPPFFTKNDHRVVSWPRGDMDYEIGGQQEASRRRHWRQSWNRFLKFAAS